MVRREVLAALIDSKKAAILKTLINSKEELYLKEIAEKSNVPVSSAFRILQQFVGLGILTRREWKTSKVYFCEKNEKSEFLRELFYEEYDGISDFVHAIANFKGIENIYLQGQKKKGKANVLLIGEDIDQEKIEETCKPIREKGFDIGFMPLTKQQYEQMVKMGLYSGEKTVLK